MNLGAFGFIIISGGRDYGDNVKILRGWRRSSRHGCHDDLFSSPGRLPVTGGFIENIFSSADFYSAGADEGKSWYYWLAIWALINTVVPLSSSTCASSPRCT